MPLDLLAEFFLSAFDLAKGAFLLSIMVFFLVLVALLVHRKLSAKFKLSFIVSSFISSFIIVFCIVFFLYVFPLSEAFSRNPLGVVPEGFEPSFTEMLYLYLSSFLKIIAVSFILTIFILPLQFVGLYVMELMKKKFKLNFLINVFASVFISTLLASFIVIYLFPWILTGVAYLLYFA